MPGTIKIRARADGSLVVTAPLSTWQSLGLLEGRTTDTLIRTFAGDAVPPEIEGLVKALKADARPTAAEPST